jgi:apolipoprotein N-acyltransferase
VLEISTLLCPTEPLQDNAVPVTRARSLAVAAWLVLASLTGVVVSLAWLDPRLFVAAIVGQTCIISYAVKHRPFPSFLFGSFVGTVALAIAFHWSPNSIAETTNLIGPWPMIAFLSLIIWESMIFGLFLYVVSLTNRHDPRLLWLAPAWWVALEFLWPRIFTWSLAHTHTSVIPILQIAEFTGTSGVSALLVLIATTLTSLFFVRELKLKPTTPLAVGFAIVLIYGWGVYRVNQVEDEVAASVPMSIAAIQVDPSYAESVSLLRERTLKLHDRIGLAVWPESSLGHYHESLSDFRDPIRTAELSEAPNVAEDPTDGFHVPLLAGGKTYSEGGRDVGPYHNTAFLIDPTKSIIGKYVKRTLMPVGEYIPGESLFPQAKELAALESSLIRGTKDDPLVLPTRERVGVLICYEDMIRDNARRTVLSGAECLVAIINGSGFRDADALAQHQRLALLRTVENRRAMVRCAATGVSCFISPTGKVLDSLPMGVQGELVAEVPRLHRLTLYTRFGEWFSWLCVVATAIVLTKTTGMRRPTNESSDATRGIVA